MIPTTPNYGFYTPYTSYMMPSYEAYASPTRAEVLKNPMAVQLDAPAKKSCCDTKPQQTHSVVQSESPRFSEQAASKLGMAGLMFISGMMLHQLPSYKGFTDWKIIARPVLGILAVAKINDAMNLKPAPWLTAVETVGVITPLISGFSKQALKQFAVMAPIVAVLTQAASSLNHPVSEKLNDTLGIPPWVSRLALSVGFIAAGVKLMPMLTKPLVRSGWLKSTGKGAEAALLQACPRGCSIGTGGICMSEIMENLSAMFASLFGAKSNTTKGAKPNGCCESHPVH